MALDFVATLERGLAGALRGVPRLHVVGVPGNHDCVLVPPLPGRSALI
jgi:hypothetical protein